MRWFAATLGLMMLAAWPGAACVYLVPFDMAKIANADLVLVGKVTRYEDLGSPQGTALISLKIEETLKGVAAGEIVLVWNGGMAQGPHERRARGRVVVGAMDGGRVAGGDPAVDIRPDLPSVIQPYCGEVWMLPATKARVAEAREVLK